MGAEAEQEKRQNSTVGSGQRRRWDPEWPGDLRGSGKPPWALEQEEGCCELRVGIRGFSTDHLFLNLTGRGRHLDAPPAGSWQSRGWLGTGCWLGEEQLRCPPRLTAVRVVSPHESAGRALLPDVHARWWPQACHQKQVVSDLSPPGNAA